MSLAIGAMANAAVDSEAQGAVTDLHEFTEYYPSDLIRSLTLIRGLDTVYMNNAHAVHELSKIYSTFPTIPPGSRPDPAVLRERISQYLDRAIDARENTVAEANRATEAARRNTSRVQSIVSKLKALPKPPSRDPTPQPVSSPEIKRSRSGRKLESTSAQRLTLNPPQYPAALAGQKRKRQLIIPGEPLPAFDPDSPIASTEQSDNETAPGSPSAIDQQIKGLKLKTPRQDNVKTPSRGSRSAAALLPRPEPPPSDAPIGSIHRPWTRITAYERFKLQKSMKKGIEWEPPHSLVQKQLKRDGRGREAYEEAKANAEKEGTELLDCDAEARKDEEVPRPPPLSKFSPPGEPIITATPPQGTIVVENRKRKAAEPKRQKKASTTSTAAATPVVTTPRITNDAARRSTLDLQSAAQGLSNFSRLLNGVFRPSTPSQPVAQPPRKRRRISSRPSTTVPSESPAMAPQESKPESEAPSLTPAVSAPESTTSSARMPLKINLPTQSTAPSTSMSSPASPKALSLRAPSPKEASRASSRIASRQPSVVPKVDPASPPPIGSRQPSAQPLSQYALATASVEPTPTTGTSRSLRRNSTPTSNLRKTPKPTGSPKTTEATAAARRSKRPQGSIAQDKEDGAAVIKTNRRKKPGPKHRGSMTAAPQGYIRTDVDGKVELIPEDEPRYCICDDVSYGDMIACDHSSVEDGCKEWFHMGCVGLRDMPGRTVEWYCPNCRVKLHKGENTNGLVGRTFKARD